MLEQKELKRILDYDKDTGIFTWKVKKAYKTNIGGIAGSNSYGYVIITINTKRYSAHRLAWLYVYGTFPNKIIDHINRIKNDNKINNLRDVSPQENQRNVKIRKNNTSGTAGVCWYKRTNKWKASIKINGKDKHLGCFLKKDDAINARKLEEKKHGYLKYK